MIEETQEALRRAGWTHDPSEGFIEFVGGLWLRESEGAREFGFIAAACHANRNGAVHGGMLMTFVDRAFGMTARLGAGAPRGATVSLSHQFMAPMQIGDFAFVAPRVVTLTPRMAFMDGTVMRGETPLLSAQGVWRLARSEG
ncbi:PaaI family thioesterase (plasmid) [Aureimonas ureilytica]|uniref:PaaI family thioesterase n=1 Tax=Aureimonas ureilytica TaxID=401562 RepID=UPI003CF3B4E7